jgi:hypothetical protein
MKIGFHSLVVVGLMATIWFGALNLLALRFKGSTLSEAWLALFGNTA